MPSLKMLAGVVLFSGGLLLAISTVSAKGLGGGHASTHTPGVPQGSGGAQWTTPPGWANTHSQRDWPTAVPPGFDHGGKTGWGTTSTTTTTTTPLPPGIQKRQPPQP